MDILRTPDHRFKDLPGFPFQPNYTQVTDPDCGKLRMHHVDEGPRDAPPILLLHGNPDWSYSFRTLISAFSAAGYRAIAPDVLGFGRSDKPVERRAHRSNGADPDHTGGWDSVLQERVPGAQGQPHLTL